MIQIFLSSLPSVARRWSTYSVKSFICFVCPNPWYSFLLLEDVLKHVHILCLTEFIDDLGSQSTSVYALRNLKGLWSGFVILLDFGQSIVFLWFFVALTELNRGCAFLNLFEHTFASSFVDIRSRYALFRESY